MLRARFFVLGFFALFLLLTGCANNKAVTPPYDPALEKYNAKELLDLGERSIAKGNSKEAIKYFHALNVKYPFSPYARQGMLDTIYATYKTDKWGSTLLEAERYIRVYPRGPDVDYAYYMRGIVNMGKGRDPTFRFLGVDPALRDLSHINDSYTDFATIVRYFPESRYAADARARMVYLRNLLARHELIVADFYYQKKAYIAAANRAATIVEYYQGAPQVQDALVLMVKSYRAIGQEALANNALRMLKLNYPNRKVE